MPAAPSAAMPRNTLRPTATGAGALLPAGPFEVVATPRAYGVRRSGGHHPSKVSLWRVSGRTRVGSGPTGQSVTDVGRNASGSDIPPGQRVKTPARRRAEAALGAVPPRDPRPHRH